MNADSECSTESVKICTQKAANLHSEYMKIVTDAASALGTLTFRILSAISPAFSMQNFLHSDSAQRVNG